MPGQNKIALALLLALSWLAPAWALGVESPLPDTAQEARAKALFHDIRCVVCQSESIADSPADIAAEIRRTVREQVAAGKDNDTIKATLVEHYGDFILMKPPLKGATALLWFGPLMVLAAAAWLAVRYFRKAQGKRA